jgi:hypothetical protein
LEIRGSAYSEICSVVFGEKSQKDDVEDDVLLAGMLFYVYMYLYRGKMKGF